MRISSTERRRLLVSVAFTLFSERGYQATTMDDVAEAAGVTKPLVYQHFSSKRALYLELIDTVALVLVTEIEKAVAAANGPRQQVEMGFEAYFNLLVTHKSAFLLLHGRDNGDSELIEAQEHVESAIVEAIDPLIDAGLNPEHRRFLAHAVIGMAEGASRHWIETGDQDARRLAARIADLAWAGLRSVHAD